MLKSENPKMESSQAVTSEVTESEKLSFYDTRTKEMSSNEYEYFVNCRRANFLSKGRASLTKWLDIQEANFHTSLELIAYLALHTVESIIIQAIKIRNDGSLAQIKTPLEVSELQPLTMKKIDEIKRVVSKIEPTHHTNANGSSNGAKPAKSGKEIFYQFRKHIHSKDDVNIDPEAVPKDQKREWGQLTGEEKAMWQKRAEAEHWLKSKKVGTSIHAYDTYSFFLKQYLKKNKVKKCTRQILQYIFEKFQALSNQDRENLRKEVERITSKRKTEK